MKRFNTFSKSWKLKMSKKQLCIVLFILLFALHFFLRVYKLEEINPFGWDQVDNAWAASSILVGHDYPLVGMQAKNNSGIYIGPLYYYFVAAVYAFTQLDPIASAYIALISSAIGFVTLFFVTLKIFSRSTAFVAVGIYTVSLYGILFDRIQWPVNFIMPLSLLIFYALFRVLQGKEKYVLLLTLCIGLSFHVHFTAVFYPLIVFMALPFFPRTKKMILYTLSSILLFLIFLSPVLIAMMTKKSSGGDMGTYIESNSHGFHLRRFFQLTKDAVIKFDSIIRWKELAFMKYVALPLFFLTYVIEKKNKERLLLCYLIGLWFLVPWFVFSLYKGEISDYYFSSTLPFVYIILAYLSVRIFQLKSVLFKGAIILFWVYFSYSNLTELMRYTDGGSIAQRRMNTEREIQQGKKMYYNWGVPESYLYYLHILPNNNEREIHEFFNPK